MKKRCQIALEYISILGFVIASTVVMVLIFRAHADSMNTQVISLQVSRLGEKIVDSAEQMYFLGEPSRTKLKLYFPPGIINATLNGRELVFFVRTANGVDEVVKLSLVNLTGSLPSSQGIHYIQVEAQSGQVVLS